MNDDKAVHALGNPQTRPRTLARAKAKITVQISGTNPCDQTASPAITEIRLSETFTGDLDGGSSVRALQVLRDDHSASLISMQRFAANWAGARAPSCFKVPKSSRTAGSRRRGWVPGSRTDDLSGLRGEGGFEGDFGKGSDATLDYWFE